MGVGFMVMKKEIMTGIHRLFSHLLCVLKVLASWFQRVVYYQIPIDDLLINLHLLPSNTPISPPP